MAVLSVFLQKKGLGSLGVNNVMIVMVESPIVP